MIETATCEILCRWGEHDTDSGKLLLERLLSIIVIRAAAYAGRRDADCLLEDLNGQEGKEQGLLRVYRAAVSEDKARLYSELVDRQLVVKQRVHKKGWLHRASNLSQVTTRWLKFDRALRKRRALGCRVFHPTRRHGV